MRKGKRNACQSGKKAFRTELDAKIALSKIWASDDDRNRQFIPKRAYYHHQCRSWHLTHTELREYQDA